MGVKNVLGRGVGALLPDEAETEAGRFFLCDIDKIKANPHQPRSYFDPEKLAELAESIRERGVIQPLLVTRAKGNRYYLIAGERRLRAARLAELEEVPVVVMEADSADEQLELALIENIQRHDLNAIEEATAYARLIEEFSLTQEEVARRVGKKRSTITNVLRLLKLPAIIQEDVVQQRLTEGHARVLLRFQDDEPFMLEMRERILAEKLSVRQTENLCRGSRKKVVPASGKRRSRPRKETGELPASYCKALANQVTNALNTKVRIVQNGERGKVEMEYYSSDDLERLVSLLTSALEAA